MQAMQRIVWVIVWVSNHSGDCSFLSCYNLLVRQYVSCCVFQVVCLSQFHPKASSPVASQNSKPIVSGWFRGCSLLTARPAVAISSAW